MVRQVRQQPWISEKVSAFYLEKQKVLFLKKYDLGPSLYLNRPRKFQQIWRFAVPIFREDFGSNLNRILKLEETMSW